MMSQRTPGTKQTRQLTVVQVTLEDDEVRFGEVLEQIWGFRVEIPKGVTGTPEGVSWGSVWLTLVRDGLDSPS